MISFMITATVTIITVIMPHNKILVYHGADCIAYKSGWLLKSQVIYMPCPIKTPIKVPIMVFNI